MKKISLVILLLGLALIGCTGLERRLDTLERSEMIHSYERDIESIERLQKHLQKCETARELLEEEIARKRVQI